MTEPCRIQRSRAKGWRMPDGVVYVGRPTKWGNPFVSHDWRASFRAVGMGFRGDRDGRNQGAVALYRHWLNGDFKKTTHRPKEFWGKEVDAAKVTHKPPNAADVQRELRGKSLACWCAIVRHGIYCPCHADVLLSIANDIPMDEVIRENIRRAERETML